MNTFKTIWMVLVLFLLCLLAVPSLRRPAEAPAGVSHDPRPPTLAPEYKYASFTFTGPTARELGKTLHAQLINYELGSDGVGARPAETNDVFGADDILTAISPDGWQFVWTDGKQYLVRRPAVGTYRHPYFLVEYHEEPK